MKYSSSANFTSYVQLTVIPNVGCSDDDWRSAHPSPAGRVALVKRGICAFRQKGLLATKYKAAALLLYNDGVTPNRMAPLIVGLAQDNNIPALFLSFSTGQALAALANNRETNAAIKMVINTKAVCMLHFSTYNRVEERH